MRDVSGQSGPVFFKQPMDACTNFEFGSHWGGHTSRHVLNYTKLSNWHDYFVISLECIMLTKKKVSENLEKKQQQKKNNTKPLPSYLPSQESYKAFFSLM